MEISSTQRSLHFLDAPLINLAESIPRKHCLSTLACWRPHVATFSPVRLHPDFRPLLFIIPTAFDLSDGVETSMTAGLPPGLDAVFDTEENDLDNDYDLGEEVSLDSQTPPEASVQIPQERPVKAYFVKYTAYRTFVTSSLCVKFRRFTNGGAACERSSGTSTQERSTCPPILQTSRLLQSSLSIDLHTRFVPYINATPAPCLRVRQHGMDHLKAVALRKIAGSIEQMEQSWLLQEAFTPSASR